MKTDPINSWTYLANVKNISNMYPYGKSYGTNAIYNATEDYRYGFNGMEKEKNFSETGDITDFGARVYEDGKFLSPDPQSYNFPSFSVYAFGNNNPIASIDPDGEATLFINGWYQTQTGSGKGEGGKKTYWSRGEGEKRFDELFMDKTGDRVAYYIDGAMGGTRNTLFNIVTPDNGNIVARKREEMGYEFAMANGVEILANLKRDKRGKLVEGISIVTHSMGTGFSRGVIRGLQELQYIVGFSPLIFETLLDVESFQAAEFPAPTYIIGDLQQNLFNNSLYKVAGENGSYLPTVGPIFNSERAGEYPDASHPIKGFDAEGVDESINKSERVYEKEFGNNNKGG